MQTHFGYEKIDLEQKQSKVNDVFHSVAGQYDLMNDVMSGGLHRVWKANMVARLNPPKKGVPFHILDVAGGTGDIAFRLHQASQGHAKTTVLDINGSMLDVGKARAKDILDDPAQLDFIEADAQELPFPDQCFDAYTIAFGLRNVPEMEKALKEAYRVLKPGGRFLCLEFSHVAVPVLDRLYDLYSFQLLPKLGQWIAKDEESYRYLAESIRQFPKVATLQNMIEESGFDHCSYTLYTGGIVALHQGFRI